MICQHTNTFLFAFEKRVHKLFTLITWLISYGHLEKWLSFMMFWLCWFCVSLYCFIDASEVSSSERSLRVKYVVSYIISVGVDISKRIYKLINKFSFLFHNGYQQIVFFFIHGLANQFHS